MVRVSPLAMAFCVRAGRAAAKARPRTLAVTMLRARREEALNVTRKTLHHTSHAKRHKVSGVLPKRVNVRSTQDRRLMMDKHQQQPVPGPIQCPFRSQDQGLLSLFANSHKYLRAIEAVRAHQQRLRNNRCEWARDGAFLPCARRHL